MSANAITITIGRKFENVYGDDVPLSEHDWMSFKQDVINVLTEYSEFSHNPTIDMSMFDGHNAYNGLDEDSFTVHAVFTHSFNPEFLPAHFWRSIENHRVFYEQDAIAVLIGTSKLVNRF